MHRALLSSRLAVERLEAREVPAAQPLPDLPTVPDFGEFGAPADRPTVYLLTAQATGGGQVRVFDFASGTERFRFNPFSDSYKGGVRVATGDVNGDDVPDIICATGGGAVASVKVFNGTTGALLRSIRPFGGTYTGGATVAAADFNNDNRTDIVVGCGGGMQPIVKVFDGATGDQLGRFLAFAPSITGGVRVATGDVTGDGTPDVVACTATGRAVVTGFDGDEIGEAEPRKIFARFYATGIGSTGGGWISCADVNDDGFADVAVGRGDGVAQAKIFSGQSLPLGGLPGLLATVRLDVSTAQTGVRTALIDLEADGTTELVLVANTGARPTVAIYDPMAGTQLDAFYAFAPRFFGGVDVG